MLLRTKITVVLSIDILMDTLERTLKQILLLTFPLCLCDT